MQCFLAVCTVTAEKQTAACLSISHVYYIHMTAYKVSPTLFVFMLLFTYTGHCTGIPCQEHAQ